MKNATKIILYAWNNHKIALKMQNNYFKTTFYTEKNNMLYLINKIVATYYKQYY